MKISPMRAGNKKVKISGYTIFDILTEDVQKTAIFCIPILYHGVSRLDACKRGWPRHAHPYYILVCVLYDPTIPTYLHVLTQLQFLFVSIIIFFFPVSLFNLVGLGVEAAPLDAGAHPEGGRATGPLTEGEGIYMYV